MDLKNFARDVLQRVGLYERARKIWLKRGYPRSWCRNLGYRLTGADDGYSIPPTQLIDLTILSRDVAWYLSSGKIGADSILFTLEKNDLSMNVFDAVLDFGCGCGRIMRNWGKLVGPRLYGTDNNPTLVDWCQKNLGSVATFGINQLHPPLDYKGGTFDFVYLISVFTHLKAHHQELWRDELARILTPGGYLLLTTHGESRILQMALDERERFLAGDLVVQNGSNSGTNTCAARGSRDCDQDIYLLQRRE
jgi:SAM-dependent methyltransferase